MGAPKEIPFIDLIKETWPFFQSNFAITIGVPAVLICVPFIGVGVPTCIVALIVGVIFGFISKDLILISELPVGVIGIILFAMACGYIRAGWINIMLKLTRNEPCSFSDIHSGKAWWINFTITMFIVGVGTAIGGYMLLIPGVFFAVRTAFAPYLVVDKNLGPIEALKESNDLVTGYSWQILFYIVLLGFTNIVLGAIPVLGAAAAMGFFDLVLTRLYRYRLGEKV